MSLREEISEKRNEIRTDDLSMSIGEWVSLYVNDEIDIHPEFQRFYRWTNAQKTNLIESILLGIPIPPIFVSQRDDGVWDVIDGLQRLSTIYEFVGILKDEDENVLDPLRLEKSKYLPSLEGKLWDSSLPTDSLDQEQRLLIKRSKLSVSIVLRESDEMAKFELFQRLNTGGSDLTPQEVRNCILVMIDKAAYQWLSNLSKFEPFQECISLSDKNISEQYDVELALRFLIFYNIDIDKYDRSKDVGEYITEQMIHIFDDNIDQKYVESVFKKTFSHIYDSLKSDAFTRYADGDFKGGFLLSTYEVIAYGLGYNYPDFPDSKSTTKRVKELFKSPTYKKWSGSGVKANSRLPHLIPLGRDLFSPHEN
jgi:uncharacterized protein with ParB-like and HNH nuclease domain